MARLAKITKTANGPTVDTHTAAVMFELLLFYMHEQFNLKKNM